MDTWCVYGDRIVLVTLKLLSVSRASSLVCDLVSLTSLCIMMQANVTVFLCLLSGTVVQGSYLVGSYWLGIQTFSSQPCCSTSTLLKRLSLGFPLRFLQSDLLLIRTGAPWRGGEFPTRKRSSLGLKAWQADSLRSHNACESASMRT